MKPLIHNVTGISMRLFTGILAFGLSCLLALPAQANPAAPATDEAQRVYEKYGDAVYQVQTIDLASGKKSGIGSGFQFTAEGLVATNYHVVAEAIRYPSESRLEYIHDKGGRGALSILAADVVHDLAILRMDKPGAAFVTLGASGLPKGARLFSLGNPHDIGFTIIEGTNNGLSRESFIDKIHFSGALNPGMSGGPALDHDGKVVGVNVSTAGNQISFLVPVEPLRDLAATLKDGGDFMASANARIAAQLLAAQDRTVRLLLGQKWETVPFGPFRVPSRLHPALKCWGVPVHQETDPYLYYRSLCDSQERIFLGDDFETGAIAFRYDRITARPGMMDPFRFHAFYEQQYAAPAGDGAAREDDVTNFSCRTAFVTVAARRWKSSFCVRAYRKYGGVFDMHLYMALADAPRDGLIATLEAEGVSRENALALAQRFMSEIKPGTAP